MSMDDCFVPFHSPLHEYAPTHYDRWRNGPRPCMSQLDLVQWAANAGSLGEILNLAAAGSGKVASLGEKGLSSHALQTLRRPAADSGKASSPDEKGVSRRALQIWNLPDAPHGEKGFHGRTLRILDRPVAVPPKRLPPPLGPLPKISPGSEQPPHLETPSLLKGNLRVLPEEQKQPHPSQVAISRSALKGKYARSRPGWATEERSSTPQDFNMEQHAWRFKPCFPQTTCIYDAPCSIDLGPPVVLRKRTEPEEVRNARREKRIALRQKAARHHAKLALRKYNRVNNTKFELLDVRAICLFFEFGLGCIHYNFRATSEDADAGSTKLFFSEVNSNFRNEKDVLLCCIVGENDAGHCYGCEVNEPIVVHPSSQAYGGGSSTCINLPCSDGSSSDSG